ncbi:MAG: 4Fe-4S dicluster domain-containing protein [Mariprofundaceae bacterium]|nr:4Fe-4S dicluster domain-containing protein [Mariprofundaceae bacterium]
MGTGVLNYFLPVAGMSELISLLRSDGYQSLALVERDGAVLWSEITDAADLPSGKQELQQPGSYRLSDAKTGCFAINHGHQSLKSLTFKAQELLVRFSKDADGIHFEPSEPATERVAVIGARACDVAGLAMQQQVFESGEYVDVHFQQHRQGLFIVVVNCIHAQETCFCASMQTGPRVKDRFDLALTPVSDGFLLECGSAEGQGIIDRLQAVPAEHGHTQQADEAIAACAASQTRSLPDTESCQQLSLLQSHPHWQDVAERCLSCGNCTMVCPTCFCHTVEEVPDLSGQQSERVRLWDSCFNPEHGYIHGKNMRPTTKERYRMWLTHKLGTWPQQFGVSGCVGCGRCITWCPVGIDLTAEAAAIVGTER